VEVKGRNSAHLEKSPLNKGAVFTNGIIFKLSRSMYTTLEEATGVQTKLYNSPKEYEIILNFGKTIWKE